MNRFLLLLLFILNTSCSSTKVIIPSPLKSGEEESSLFKDFQPSKNYHLTFNIEYPTFSRQTKSKAQSYRKSFLINSVNNIIDFIYMLPQNQTVFENGSQSTPFMSPNNDYNSHKQCFDYKVDNRKVVCTKDSYGTLSKNYIRISPRDYIEAVKSQNGGNEVTYKHNPYHIIDGKKFTNYLSFPWPGRASSLPSFLTVAPDDFHSKLKASPSSIQKINLTDRFFKPLFIEKNYLKQVYDEKLLKISTFIQYIALRTSDNISYGPIINANEKLIAFTRNYTFPQMTNKEFKPIKDRIFNIIEQFSLNKEDELNDYFISVLKGYLFFGEWDYTEGFSSIDESEFQRFLTNESLRQRMFGLAMLSYSTFKAKRVDKNNLIFEVEINIKKMFKDIHFVKIDDLYEK